MERIHIKFDGRTPITDSAIISVGVEGDKNATELLLEVPRIVESQIAVLNMVMGEYNADSLVIPEDGIVPISHDMFDDSGIFKAWVTVTNAGNETVWQSYAWRMKWEDIPNVEDVLENGNPGILKKMAATIRFADMIEQERSESFSRLNLVASRVENGVLVEATNVDGTTTSALLADGQGAGSSAPAIDPNSYFTTYASGWSGSAPYSVVVAVPGILETDAPLVYPDQAAADEAAMAAWACISEIDTADGSITVYAAETLPAAAIPIFLKVVR